MSKRRRTSSDIDSEESDESEQFPVTPAIRKKKKLDPVSFWFSLLFLLLFFTYCFLDGAMSITLRVNKKL